MQQWMPSMQEQQHMMLKMNMLEMKQEENKNDIAKKLEHATPEDIEKDPDLADVKKEMDQQD